MALSLLSGMPVAIDAGRIQDAKGSGFRLARLCKGRSAFSCRNMGGLGAEQEQAPSSSDQMNRLPTVIVPTMGRLAMPLTSRNRSLLLE